MHVQEVYICRYTRVHAHICIYSTSFVLCIHQQESKQQTPQAYIWEPLLGLNGWELDFLESKGETASYQKTDLQTTLFEGNFQHTRHALLESGLQSRTRKIQNPKRRMGLQTHPESPTRFGRRFFFMPTRHPSKRLAARPL